MGFFILKSIFNQKRNLKKNSNTLLKLAFSEINSCSLRIKMQEYS